MLTDNYNYNKYNISYCEIKRNDENVEKTKKLHSILISNIP